MGAIFWVAFSLGAPGAFVEFSGAVMFVIGAFTGDRLQHRRHRVAGKDMHTEATTR